MMDRRAFVRGVGMVTVAGSLAGCSGGGDSSGGEPTSSGNSEVSSYLAEEDYFNDEQNGQIEDLTGESNPVVEVGVDGNGGPNAFGPSAIKVSTGTTVTWEWTGEGLHNVAAKDGSFESETQETGTFEQPFDEAGTVLYYCVPHKSLGMRGAVVVE